MCRKLFYLITFVLVLVAAPEVTHAQVENLLLNPSFEEDENINAGPQWWTWNPAEGAGSTATIVDTEFVDGARSLRVEPLGGTSWYFEVIQTIPFNVGTTYTYSFWIKAEADRPLSVQFKANDNSVSWGLTDFQLTTEWAEYYLTSPSQNASVKLEMHCAAVDTPFWLDFAYVYEGPSVAGMGPTQQVKAADPDPADEAQVEGTFVTMTWKAGDFAVSHDTYMGDNFDDVNDGTRESDLFRGNQDSLYLVAGFPTYPFPDGLVPGTTYYWRIDEVNDADPNSPWKGDVWSFTVPSLKAYEPDPVDGAEFIATDVTLNWTGGLDAVLHTIFFGESFEEVEAATEGIPSPFPTYTPPGGLESEKTYYWRVDEYDEDQNTHTGDVWNFTTLPNIPISDPDLVGWWKLDEGAGLTAVDWSGHGNHGTLTGDPQWVMGYDADALEFDGDGDYVEVPHDVSLTVDTEVTVMAWINAERHNSAAGNWQGILGKSNNPRSYSFYTYTDGTLHFSTDVDGAHVGSNSTGLVPLNEWVHVAAAMTAGGQHLYYINGEPAGEGVAGATLPGTTDTATVRIGMTNEGGNGFLGLIDDARIYNKALTQDEIKQVMRGDPLVAWNPSPGNGATPFVSDALPLTWSPGDNASQHDVYYGTDRDAVKNADTTTADIYRGRQAGTSYSPPEGVEWGGGPYYWRIDQVNTDATIAKGRVWKFTVADNIPIDDFEDYDIGNNEIWFSWHDGLGAGSPGTPEYVPSNGTGSEIGDGNTGSYTEETIVHGGNQSMPYWYNNNKGQGFSKYSEAKLTLTDHRDWTQEGVAELSIWFRGNPASVGSFVESPVGTYTMTGSGADIWFATDEFHYAFKTLTGAGSIQARVESITNTHASAKAAVMIRDTLAPDSKYFMAAVRPGSNGVIAEYRADTGIDAEQTGSLTDVTAPYWVKIERNASSNFTAYSSTDGSTWQAVGFSEPIPMGGTVNIGLAVTSHNAAQTCQAVFSNVTTTGVGQWANQDIGIASNAAEPLYVAVANSTGLPAVVVHDDPLAATIDSWTEWVIPLQAFADQGIVLTNVDSLAIGMGTRDNVTIPGGSGKMYFDDVRLYQLRVAAE